MKKLKLPRPYKTEGEFKKAELRVRIDTERKLDAFHGRKPLTLDEIVAKAHTVEGFSEMENGTMLPTSILLIAGADRFKDDPEELYNYYLLEIKPLLK